MRRVATPCTTFGHGEIGPRIHKTRISPCIQVPSTALRTVGGAETVRLAVVVGALGVVFGDIGTSPIYTIQTVFNPSDPHPVPISADHVYGIVSLIFWSVMIIVTLTYVNPGDARR